METTMSRDAQDELIRVLRSRYGQASKREKTMILDQFVAVVKCHRKHAVRLLVRRESTMSKTTRVGRRVYDEAVREALIILWETSDRICGKRLRAILPHLIDSMERYGHVDLDSEVRSRLLSVSPATIDRLLAPIRDKAVRRKKRHSFRKKINKRVPIRTFADWDEPQPGYLEIDLVVHSGGSMAGAFVHSLVATDVCSGWTDAVSLPAREQSLIVEGLKVIRSQIPMPLIGIDSDNDSAFINETLLSYCEREQIEFTRSRAYQKNDQAFIEQKNGAIIRRFVGYDRFSGMVAAQALAHLYHTVRLYVNYFQPSFKLRRKTRNGARVRRWYYKPATPCDRLLDHSSVDETIKEKLRSHRARLDPVELLHRIRDGQSALASLNSPGVGNSPGRRNLEQFLAELPRLWRLGEVRPTHRSSAPKRRSWRTRKDPFESVWPEILLWLQENPDATATSLLIRLQNEYPGCFPNGQLRTLQRRVGEWREIMAKKLVYSCIDGYNDGYNECAELEAIAVGVSK